MYSSVSQIRETGDSASILMASLSAIVDAVSEAAYTKRLFEIKIF